MFSLNKIAIAVFFVASLPAYADPNSSPDSHAPIGVMGDHTHDKGEWMVSYRFMDMQMEDNLLEDDSISPIQIVTTIPNRFNDLPMMPPTLRVVPVEMQTRMHMLGVMYAPTDKITLMAMLNYVEKEMDHITFQGGMGTNVLGQFTTDPSGLGDAKLGLLYRLMQGPVHKLHANFSVSLPLGDIEQTDQILTPMGMTPSPRLPYPMQLSSGTWDVEPGITYTGHSGVLGWGAQFKYLYRISDNKNGYTLGNKTSLTSWASYTFSPHISAALRLSYYNQQQIEGIDTLIIAPVQTADPDNSGGNAVNLGVGLNYITDQGHRFALEYENTIDQRVNGVQMEMKNMLTFGYQYAF